MIELNYATRYMTLTFTAAEENYEVEWVGERLYVDEASADFTIRLNSRNSDAIPMKAKKSLLMPYKKFFITVTGANTIQLFLSNPGNIELGGNEINVDTIEKVEKTADGTHDNVSVGVAAGVIVAANEDRKAVTIQNLDADNVYIGFDNTVTVNNGYLLRQYGSITMDRYTGAVYGISDAAASDVRYLEEG